MKRPFFHTDGISNCLILLIVSPSQSTLLTKLNRLKEKCRDMNVIGGHYPELEGSTSDMCGFEGREDAVSHQVQPKNCWANLNPGKIPLKSAIFQ